MAPVLTLHQGGRSRLIRVGESQAVREIAREMRRQADQLPLQSRDLRDQLVGWGQRLDGWADDRERS